MYYVDSNTGNAYDVIGYLRLSGPRAPHILNKSTPVSKASPAISL